MITIKIGGSVVGNLHASTIPDIKLAAESEGGLVIVHGGGKDVTEISTKLLGREPRFITSPSGVRSRYTDRKTAEIFAMVMAGKINKAIVRVLQEGGVNAVGISGVDGGLLRADRKKKLHIVNEKGRTQAIDGGYTGKISSVNDELLKALIERKMTPVIAPVALSEEYEYLNVDGDRAAASVAAAMGASRILFMTNVDGLIMDEKIVHSISTEEARQMRPKIGPGMEKKVIAAIEALEGGVSEALIASGKRENPVSSAIAHDGCTVISG